MPDPLGVSAMEYMQANYDNLGTPIQVSLPNESHYCACMLSNEHIMNLLEGLTLEHKRYL